MYRCSLVLAIPLCIVTGRYFSLDGITTLSYVNMFKRTRTSDLDQTTIFRSSSFDRKWRCGPLTAGDGFENVNPRSIVSDYYFYKEL
jgi:hypothetical protein